MTKRAIGIGLLALVFCGVILFTTSLVQRGRGLRHDLDGLRQYAVLPGSPTVTWVSESGGSAGMFRELTTVRAQINYPRGDASLEGPFNAPVTHESGGATMDDIQPYPPPFALVPTNVAVTFIGPDSIVSERCSGDPTPLGYLARVGTSGVYVLEMTVEC